MQLTHQEARRLIQLKADDALNSRENMALSVHLQGCLECQTYAEEIKEVESLLLPLLKRQWNSQPAPLSISTIAAKRFPKIPASAILATRTAMVAIVFVAVVFSAWQFIAADSQIPNLSPVGILPVPTPSAQSTSTKIMLQKCPETLYHVQENDTLESIANQFSISKEDILAINGLKSETLNTSMKLIIPVCGFTPTGTLNPTRLTTTYTPLTDHSTSTPGG
ncbi:MAG TPA: LysM peptidoglycan-binding domain-containing protein [Anaerolineales bacterium]|nr:LysM peptidoglycan-binding domain-containing protein [Anaerolineales bacterium]